MKALHCIINKKVTSIDSILDSIDSVSKKMIDEGKKTSSYDDPLFLINLILEDSRKNNFLLIVLFSKCIIHNQLCNNLFKYGINVEMKVKMIILKIKY